MAVAIEVWTTRVEEGTTRMKVRTTRVDKERCESKRDAGAESHEEPRVNASG
ncbi:hypothetical protein K523DRAFT_324598, partial [Schizophyllum commune Tattone D]